MRKLLSWLGLALLQLVAMALMNHWKPRMGLGDVVWLVGLSFLTYHILTRPVGDTGDKT